MPLDFEVSANPYASGLHLRVAGCAWSLAVIAATLGSPSRVHAQTPPLVTPTPESAPTAELVPTAPTAPTAPTVTPVTPVTPVTTSAATPPEVPLPSASGPNTTVPVAAPVANPPGPVPAVDVAPTPVAPAPVPPAPGQPTPPWVAPAPAATTPPWVYPPRAEPRRRHQPHRWQGVHVQPRFFGTFGVNFPHEFAEECPTSSCELDRPIGGGGGAYVGYSWGNTGVHVVGLALADYSGVDVELPPSLEPSGASAEGSGGGGFDIDFSEDGIDFDGDLFGGGSAAGDLGSDDEEPGDAHVLRSGVAIGLGVQHAFFRRPVRLNTGFSAGAVVRTVKGVSTASDSVERYTAPFIAGDVGFAFGRRSSFLLGVFAFVEFVPRLELARNGVFANVDVITRGPQVFLGPYLAFQWGPRGRPVHAADESEYSEQ